MSIKPVIRELKQAVMHGMRHADDRLPQMADNLFDHFDSLKRSVRDLDHLDDAVSRGWLKNRRLRRGGKTDVGWHFLPEKDRAAAGDVPEYPGEYVLDLHGSPNAVQGGDGSMLSAEDFADHVRKHTDWDGQTPIRLFSCDTGADPDGFAQQLSNHLDVDVTAPTKPVWSTKSGSPFVTDVDPITGAPVWPPNGGWVPFQPKGL
ncbi:hypothetical protein [Microbacterium sp. SD291]|uniref:hypothetical protein n=1 Tax=Microbacterium sp. SD291 TaxID=2782007 RepID=UPI001A977A98|nr:hypothetical protein [Microbacterium sp. SD291]MBO0980396.1 hypothetical protein [Microbacterium sp. SD291]